MSRRLVLTLGLVMVVLLGMVPAASASPVQQAQETFLVRFVHAVPEAPTVDILVDGVLAASQLAYAQPTAYLRLDPGEHLVNVQAAGATLAETTLNAAAGQAITAIIMGTPDAPQIMVFEDDLSPLVLGNIRLSAIHAAAGIDAVDVVLPDGSPVLQGLGYGEGSGSIDIPANTYPLAVTPTGGAVDSAIRPVTDYHLAAGQFYRLVILSATPDILLLSAPALASGDSVYASVAHAIPGAPAVDVYLNGVLAVPSLEALTITPFVALPLGVYELTVRTAGSDTTVAPIATTSLDLSDSGLADQARTIAAVTDGSSLSLQVFNEDFADLDPATARVSILNTLVGTGLLAELDNGTTLDTGAAFESVAPTEFAAEQYELLVSSEGGGSAALDMAFNGGMLYRVLVAGSAEQFEVRLSQTALNLRPGSAVALAAAPVAVAVQPTAAPVVEQPTEAPVQPTEAPAVAETPIPTQAPQVLPVAEGPIGQIFNLNPGANVQLRQYPNANALSLGRVSAGTVVLVLGRAGEPDFENLADLPPDDDLDPAQTWLSVVYTTPEGGSITAWVIAQYVRVTEDGKNVRLADLDPLPSNVPGEATGVSTTQPTAAPSTAAFYGVVFNLNPGANLNIRRTPDTLAEVLAAVPNGTVLEPIGLLDDYSWTFVNYLPEGGGVITGWVSTEYLQFVFRGNTYRPAPDRINELLMRSLMIIVEPTERGSVSDDVVAQSTATAANAEFRNRIVATTVLDPGANLHLRRTPDAVSESLALIPGNATLLVIGRTADSGWLQVEYDNTTGWVNSAWVELRLNNRRIELADVPAVQ